MLSSDAREIIARTRKIVAYAKSGRRPLKQIANLKKILESKTLFGRMDDDARGVCDYTSSVEIDCLRAGLEMLVNGKNNHERPDGLKGDILDDLLAASGFLEDLIPGGSR